MTAAELVAARPISDVWAALGGGTIRHGRARAFYRDGDNVQAVSLDDAKGCYFDHRDGQGGGVLDLIGLVLSCDRQAAVRWLAEWNGAALDGRRLTSVERRQHAVRASAGESDQRDCRWWAMTARELGEECLKASVDDERFPLTTLVQEINAAMDGEDEARRSAAKAKIREAARIALLEMFRVWREQYPELTRAMVWAGARHEERRQVALATWIDKEMEAEQHDAAA